MADNFVTHDGGTQIPLAPLDTKAILWLAALDRVPIEDRIEWVEKMTAQVEEINAARARAE